MLKMANIHVSKLRQWKSINRMSDQLMDEPSFCFEFGTSSDLRDALMRQEFVGKSICMSDVPNPPMSWKMSILKLILEDTSQLCLLTRMLNVCMYSILQC